MKKATGRPLLVRRCRGWWRAPRTRSGHAVAPLGSVPSGRRGGATARVTARVQRRNARANAPGRRSRGASLTADRHVRRLERDLGALAVTDPPPARSSSARSRAVAAIARVPSRRATEGREGAPGELRRDAARTRPRDRPPPTALARASCGRGRRAPRTGLGRGRVGRFHTSGRMRARRRGRRTGAARRRSGCARRVRRGGKANSTVAGARAARRGRPQEQDGEGVPLQGGEGACARGEHERGASGRSCTRSTPRGSTSGYSATRPALPPASVRSFRGSRGRDTRRTAAPPPHAGRAADRRRPRRLLATPHRPAPRWARVGIVDLGAGDASASHHGVGVDAQAPAGLEHGSARDGEDDAGHVPRLAHAPRGGARSALPPVLPGQAGPATTGRSPRGDGERGRARAPRRTARTRRRSRPGDRRLRRRRWPPGEPERRRAMTTIAGSNALRHPRIRPWGSIPTERPQRVAHDRLSRLDRADRGHSRGRDGSMPRQSDAGSATEVHAESRLLEREARKS